MCAAHRGGVCIDVHPVTHLSAELPSPPSSPPPPPPPPPPQEAQRSQMRHKRPEYVAGDLAGPDIGVRTVDSDG